MKKFWYKFLKVEFIAHNNKMTTVLTYDTKHNRQKYVKVCYSVQMHPIMGHTWTIIRDFWTVVPHKQNTIINRNWVKYK
jgi:hypothetical protein